MGAFDKLRERLGDVEEEAEDAAVSVDDLRKSDDELMAELDAELEGLDADDEEEEPGQAEAGASAPAVEPEPATSQPPEPAQPEPEPTSEPDGQPEPSPAPAAKPEPTRTPEPEGTPKKQARQTKGKYQIDPDRVEDLLWDLELVLLEADVAAEVAHELRDTMEQRLTQVRVDDKRDVPKAIEAELRTAIRGILEGGSFGFDEWVMMNTGEDPLVVMFVGVNGTGKTTTIARVAHRMKGLGYGMALAAGDTYRAGAIEQLEEHGRNLGLRVIKHEAGSDPAAVCYDAVDHAKSRKKDLVLVDTAGRMQTDSNLMEEMKKINRVANPDLTIFVGDSLAGNDAIKQAQEFDAAVGVDACVLTKVDTDAKGGAALSIARAVGKPVAFLGVGQDYDDIIPFDPDWLIQRIFGE